MLENKGRIKGLLLGKEFMQRRKRTCILREPVSPQTVLLLTFIWTSVGWIGFYHLQRLFLLPPLLESLRQLPAFTFLYFHGWETVCLSPFLDIGFLRVELMTVTWNVSGKNTRRYSLLESGHVSRVRLLSWKDIPGKCWGAIMSLDTSEVPVKS